MRKHVSYKQMNIITKKSEEKTRQKIFSKNTRIWYPKNFGKKSSQKVRKHVFYKHMNIVTKKWGEKTPKKSFPETHVYREQKTMDKNRVESAKTRFL